jgi:HKD family nuclease
MQVELLKGLNLIQKLSENCQSALICSFRINPWALKNSLGKNFPYESLIIFSGERSLDLEQSMEAANFYDSSCIPIQGHSFHSKLYIFEKITGEGNRLEVIVPSFNATSAGLSQNLEFWSYASSSFKKEYITEKNLSRFILEHKGNNLTYSDLQRLFVEDDGQIVVASAVEVLWRLANNGFGLAPGRPVCIPDVLLASAKYKSYSSILVHTLGNNSLSKALDYMLQEALENSNEVLIRAISPYHNFEGIAYFHKRCVLALGDRKAKIEIELLTVFPPDFPEKFGDPKTQPFAPLEDVKRLSASDPRISIHIKLWKKNSEVITPQIDIVDAKEQTQSAFLHGKVFLIKTEDRCSFLLGSPNLTNSAFGEGPNLNFETAIWERNTDNSKALWNDMNPLFSKCLNANKEDYDALRTWFTFYGSNEPVQSVEVRGPRDAIERFVTVSLQKGQTKQELFPYQETTVFFDETQDAHIVVKLEPGIPRFLKKANILVCPSDFEQTQLLKVEFSKRVVSTKLPFDTLKADTISIKIDIKSKLIEERQVTVSQYGSRIKIESFHLPINRAQQEVYLLVYTNAGVREISCDGTNEQLIGSLEDNLKLSKKIAFLRIYSTEKNTVNALGYFRIRCRKRFPITEVNAVCIERFPISIHFRELENLLAARILPESVFFTVLGENGLEIPSVQLAIKRNDAYPLVQTTLILLNPNQKNKKFIIETKFADEHEGYHINRFSQETGYWKSNDLGVTFFIPRNAGSNIYYRKDENRSEKISPSAVGIYNRFLSPTFPSFIEAGADALYFSDKPIPQVCVNLLKSLPTVSPSAGWITTSSPLIIQLDNSVKSRDANLVKRVTLDWFMHYLGHEQKGTSKCQFFASPTIFKLLPEEMRPVEAEINSITTRESLLDFDVRYDLQEGYVCKYQHSGIVITSRQEMFDRIHRDIWRLIRNKEILINELCEMFSHYLPNISLQLFKRAIKGEELAREILIHRFKISPVVCSDGHFEFAIGEDANLNLLKQTCNKILTEAYSTFSTSDNMPKISNNHFIEGLEKKLQEEIECLLIIKKDGDSKLMAPSRLFEKINSSWHSIL